MENLAQKQQNMIIYLALCLNNLLYLLIIIMLGVSLEIEFNNSIFYIFIAGMTISLTIMLFITRNALLNELDRSKTIINLAIAHVPALLGVVYYMLFAIALT
jgi:hypothetical protein